MSYIDGVLLVIMSFVTSILVGYGLGMWLFDRRGGGDKHEDEE